MSDPRQTPARADLAAAHLVDTHPAPRYAKAAQFQVTKPLLDMRNTPDAGSLSSQLLFGEAFDAYEVDAKTGLAWGQSLTDGYVGYVQADGLMPRGPAATHVVETRVAQTYAEPDLKQMPTLTLPWQARLTVTDQDKGYARVGANTWIAAAQLAPADQSAADFVSVAKQFLGTPYVWGGRSVYGLDCSALVQLALQAAGHPFPRDSDLQEDAVAASELPLRRGDLVFWDGHVGIMEDSATLLHANAHHMAVVSEPLAEAAARISRTGTGPISSYGRIPD
ncbi:MAG: NlpC/P60 family protein [Pseudomonadota bacterium]